MSNQIPTVTSSPPPSIGICGDITRAGEVGPVAGIMTPAIINPSDFAPTDTPSGEPLYRSGTEIGRVTEFVMIKHWRDDVQLKVVPEVAGYLMAMIEAALAEPVSIRLGIASGFRTMSEQRTFYDKYRAGTGNPAARPGTSNHQNGIAFDFNVTHQDGRVFEWMTRNAWKYGFVRAVPNERWHWEYWGDWIGQEKPAWAQAKNNWHTQKTMFSIVGRISSVSIPVRHRWSTKFTWATSNTDATGKTNSWIGAGNEHLPDKLDRIHAGWDRA